MKIFAAIIEWDSASDPTLITGPDPATVRRMVATKLPEFIPEEEDFFEKNPTPDNDLQVWLRLFRDANTEPWVTFLVSEGPGEAQLETHP